MPKHPDLLKKLQLLYKLRLNPKIKTNTDLARSLEITKQAISRWIHGSETRIGDQIPIDQLPRLAEIFNIKEHWLALPLTEFEGNVFQLLDQQAEINLIRPDKISISLLPSTNTKVFGREDEVNQLNEAWQDNETNIVQILAFGGVGKSCLINYWLSKLNSENYFGAKRIYAWSFYWQGSSGELKSSGDFFVEHALEWFGDKDPMTGSPWAKATRLANLIRQEKTLLILDGLEPLQFSPGPNSGHVENPAVALLIKELASANNGLCIISSRLRAEDLSSYQSNQVKTIELSELSIEASVALLRSMNVNGDKDEIEEAAQNYSCHPLSLTLLGGYLNVVYDGEIKYAKQISTLFDEQSGADHAAKIMQAYLSWFEGVPESALLYLLGLLDRATTLAELKSIVKLEKIEGLTSELMELTHAQWCFAIQRLCDARLVFAEHQNLDMNIDCHPLVRDYLSDYLVKNEPTIWASGHTLIFEYLSNLPITDSLKMTNLEPLFRAVIHGAQAKIYNRAFQLYFERIKRRQFSLFTSGSHYADQACIRAFFIEEWTHPVSDLNEEAKYYLLSCAATNLIYLGDISEAIKPAMISIDWFSNNGMWIEATSAAAPLTSMLIAAGRLLEAKQLLVDMDKCIENTQNQIIIATASNFRGFIEYLLGDKNIAETLFKDSEKYLDRPEPASPVLFPTISSYYCKFLLETDRHQEALERLLKTFAWRERKTWQVAIDTTSLYASDLLVLGLTFLRRGDLINARIYLDKQVDLFRSADEWLYLPTGLHSRARYFIAVGDIDSATNDLDEALEIATKTGARFGEWESYLNFAYLYCRCNDAISCAEYLGKAKSLPGMEAYKFRDSEITELEAFILSDELANLNTGKSGTLNSTIK